MRGGPAGSSGGRLLPGTSRARAATLIELVSGRNVQFRQDPGTGIFALTDGALATVKWISVVDVAGEGEKRAELRGGRIVLHCLDADRPRPPHTDSFYLCQCDFPCFQFAVNCPFLTVHL